MSMEFFIITNEIPESGTTRAQLLAMLRTLKASGFLADGSTLEVPGDGRMRIKAVPQDKVTGLATTLIGKQPLNGLLSALSTVSTNGVLARAGSSAVTVLEIGSDLQAHDDLLDAIAALGSNGVIARTGSGSAAVLAIGTDLQGWNALLQAIADAGPGAAVDDVDDSDIPATISDPPTQAEVEGLKDALVKTNTTVNAILDRLRELELIQT